MSAASYTPELSDLMEHEKVIEQGLGTFIEVGSSLLAIRDGKKYRAAGFSTFELYCRERWSMTDGHARRLVGAAEAVTAIKTLPIGMVPDSESQVRPLVALPTPEAKAEAWSEAVDQAKAEGRDKPTAKHVQAAVEKRRPPKVVHPAPFSDPIIDAIASRVEGADTVLDPFAGTGRVHELRDRANVTNTIGVELEPEWAAMHPDTIEGNALHLPVLDETVDAIATSPTYGNRMADHHKPSESDGSTRLTYTHTLGHDLADDNSGAMQWGDEYREFHFQAWAEALRVLRPGGCFVLNIKDHIRAGVKQEVAAWHTDTLCRFFGLELTGIDVIPTKGIASGENADKKVAAELVLTFMKNGS